jgi:hypothetical protein
MAIGTLPSPGRSCARWSVPACTASPSTAPTITTRWACSSSLPRTFLGLRTPVEHYELDKVLQEINDVQAAVEELLTTGCTPLPAEPDLETISEWSVNAHRRHWGWI